MSHMFQIAIQKRKRSQNPKLIIILQLPYAGIAALASFVAYLILGFTNANIWIMLVVALALLIVFYLLSCRLWGVKAAESK